MHDPGKHGRDDATQGHKGQVQSTRDGTLLGGPGNIITGFASGIGTSACHTPTAFTPIHPTPPQRQRTPIP